MADYSKLSESERAAELAELTKRYEDFKSRGLKLDMTRGKPSPEQLDLAAGMLDLPGKGDFKSRDGVDTRNYGGLDGIAEVKELFAEFLGADPANVLIGGNASLTLMHDTVVRALMFGVPGGDGPWLRTGAKFLCPVPGYDRHFAICEHFGIEMIPVDTDSNGPDMDQVEKLAAEDAAVKGIWCVPKYSNPTGIVYSDEVVDRLAKMKTAAGDFRVFWDNAYAVHHLGSLDPLKNILKACADAGNPDRPLVFGSTSKISFAGAGLSAMAASEANIAETLKHLAKQTIGPDKVNQLRHIKFFKNMDGLRAHMDKHAAILKPKFDAVLDIFRAELGDKNIAVWTEPRGGYFVSLDTPDDCASDVVAMAGDCGVKMTGAGATFPYKKDPRNRNIRIAPSLPSLDEIKTAMEIVAICVRIVSLKKLGA